MPREYLLNGDPAGKNHGRVRGGLVLDMKTLAELD